MTKIRLDALLVERGIFESREKARRAVLAGRVKIDNSLADKPGAATDSRASVFVEPAAAYVSRGADKLLKALAVFDVDVSGRAALDAGASTGGFTEVLLERGARRVMAVDVGYGQLAWKLRQDSRVDVLDRTNIRYLTPEELPEKAGLVTADLSFISLVTAAGALMGLSDAGADFIFLIKPQFEAGKGKVGKGGIIREAPRHEEILASVISRLAGHGLVLQGLTFSPLTGADGNIEFLAHFKRQEFEITNNKQEIRNTELTKVIKDVVREAHIALAKKSQ